MMKNILVFPCGSEIAFEIYRSLKYSKHFRLIGANSVRDHGRFVFEEYIPDIPFVLEEKFVSVMKEIVRNYKIDYIYPAMDLAIDVLKRAEQELGCCVIASPKETTRICLSKKKTYEVFHNILPIPLEYEPNHKLTFPVFCKPDMGYGSRGAAVIKNRKMLERHLQEYPNAMILEYLPGKEYTVDCFTDKEGVLLFCGVRERNRILNGISVNTLSVNEKGVFQEIAERINSVLKLQGAWFVQLKCRADGEPVILEIASRMGGSSALYRARGINFAQLSLFDAMGMTVTVIDNGYKVEMDRALDNRFKIDLAYNEVFIDYDDTLVLSSCKYNLEAVKFLFDCKNRETKITLLTAHRGRLEEEQEYIRLQFLFDRVIHITPKDNKADYIDNNHAVFIDDSFAERKRVWEQKQIPVFSVDMIECLM